MLFIPFLVLKAEKVGFIIYPLALPTGQTTGQRFGYRANPRLAKKLIDV